MRTRLKLSSSTLRNLEGMVFILPWVLGFLFFVAFPMAYSLRPVRSSIRALYISAKILDSV